MASDGEVQWPGNAVSQKSDLAAPAVELLHQLKLLPDPSEDDLRKGPISAAINPPDSLQIIESSALAINKGWAAIVAAVGGGGALATALGGFYGGQPNGVKQAMIWGAAVVLAASVLAIALIIRSDVSGRAAATVATYRARADVVDVFLKLAAGAQVHKNSENSHASDTPTPQQSLLATLAGTGKLKVRLASEDTFHHVSSAIKSDHGIQLKIGGVLAPIDNVKDFELSV
jgi:hypothetical protein